MTKRFLLTTLSSKFHWIVERAITNQIAHERALRDDDNTPDEVWAEFDYGNDTVILQIVLDEFNNTHQWVDGNLYVLSEGSMDGYDSSTLQVFGEPIPGGEAVKWVFLAKDFDEACAIKNRLMDFEPYQPMPTNIAIEDTFTASTDSQLIKVDITIYQPQKFDETWQCDYVIKDSGRFLGSDYHSVRGQSGLAVLNQAIQSTKHYLQDLQVQGFVFDKQLGF